MGRDEYPVCERERQRGAEVLAQELMPNFFETALPAGCAVAFDASIWHTTFANHSGHDRCGCHFNYCSSGARNLDVQPKLSEATLRRLEVEGKLGAKRREVLGLQSTGYNFE